MRLRHLCKDEEGQSLFLMAMCILMLLGTAGLVIDLGYAYHAQRELQASADAAATAGALDLPLSATLAVQDANTASGVAGAKNAVNDIVSVSMANGYPLVTCFQPCATNQTTNCVPNVSTVPDCSYNGTATGNVVVVQETGVSPTFFSKVLGWKALTINVTSVALAKGSSALPMNIMMVVDSTESMTNSDPNCWSANPPSGWPFGSPTREDCAKWGIRTLLVNLNPNAQNVGLATFPGVSNDSAEYDCWSPSMSAGNGIVPYNSPISDSLVIPLSSGYLNSSGALATSSDLVGTVYWQEPGSDCSGANYGLQDPGGEGTYYTDAIDEAASVLNAATPQEASAIVVLGDGTANMRANNVGQSGSQQPCTDAISAATAAAADGITLFSVAYDAPTTGYSASGGQNCGPADPSSMTPCIVMQQIASSPGNFYADAESAANGCVSTANAGLTDLGSIFKGVAQQLSSGNTRILPSSLYVPPGS